MEELFSKDTILNNTRHSAYHEESCVHDHSPYGKTDPTTHKKRDPYTYTCKKQWRLKVSHAAKNPDLRRPKVIPFIQSSIDSQALIRRFRSRAGTQVMSELPSSLSDWRVVHIFQWLPFLKGISISVYQIHFAVLRSSTSIDPDVKYNATDLLLRFVNPEVCNMYMCGNWTNWGFLLRIADRLLGQPALVSCRTLL